MRNFKGAMYQIFINEKCLILTEKRTSVETPRHLVVNFTGNKSIFSTIELLEKNNKYDSAEIISYSLKDLWKKFVSFYNIIEAAGGLVLNKQKEILMIYRLGKWDLPKGKIEKGEKKKDAAIREVEEECGIDQLEIIHKLNTTYHCYFLKKKRVLKKSYWYLMQTTYQDELTPQLEENITEVRWVNKNEIPELLNNTYASIALLFEKHLEEL